MKTFSQISFVCYCFISFSSVAQSSKNIEERLNKSFKRISYWELHKNDRNVSGDDSLEKANDFFQQKLKEYTVKYQLTLKQRFLKIENLNVAVSGDGNLKCYSWDDGTGGTMRYYKNVIQYKIGNQLFSESIETGMLDEIYTIKIRNITYYLVTHFAQAMSGYYSEGISMWTIKNGRLYMNPKLFKTGFHLTSSIDYSYYMDERFNGHLRYDKKTNVLYIPVTTEDERLTGKHAAYIFSGRYFEKMKS
ncbi:MAG: hypothetical protein ABI113_23530 [Mucilaginibacter sp.]